MSARWTSTAAPTPPASARTRSPGCGIKPGAGRITVNGREGDSYFARPVPADAAQPALPGRRPRQPVRRLVHGQGRRAVGARRGRCATASRARSSRRAGAAPDSQARRVPDPRRPRGRGARNTASARRDAASSSPSARPRPPFLPISGPSPEGDAMASTANAVRTAILGASGYTGAELVRILLHHPSVEIRTLTADRHAGKPFDAVFPQFGGRGLPGLVRIERTRLGRARPGLLLPAARHHAGGDRRAPGTPQGWWTSRLISGSPTPRSTPNGTATNTAHRRSRARRSTASPSSPAKR